MCDWGTDEQVRLKIAAHLSHSGESRWREMGVDRCIAPIVKALQEAGIDMLASCCGHGKGPGRIDLADGRVLHIQSRVEASDAEAVSSCATKAKSDSSSSPPAPSPRAEGSRDDVNANAFARGDGSTLSAGSGLPRRSDGDR